MWLVENGRVLAIVLAVAIVVGGYLCYETRTDVSGMKAEQTLQKEMLKQKVDKAELFAKPAEQQPKLKSDVLPPKADAPAPKAEQTSLKVIRATW